MFNFNLTKDLHGWCDEEKSKKMYDLIIAEQPELVVEIGVFGGRSLFPQALALKENKKGIIYGIDSWNKEESIKFMKESKHIDWWYQLDYKALYVACKKFISKHELKNYCELKKCTSKHFLKEIQNKFIDILHIDGNHEEESSCFDVESYVPLVKDGGYVWFDDNHWHQTQKAISILRDKFKLELITNVSNCSLYKKKILPKIFCITLKSTPERKDRALMHFQKNKINVEFFNGINGKEFGLCTKIPYRDDDPKNDLGVDSYITQGHVGCILSHYMLWQTLQYLPHNEIMILEDDAILTDDFLSKFQKYKSQLPDDWQYVFLGYCCLPESDKIISVTENIITTTIPPLCTHGYMIKRESLPVLLDTNHIAWAHIDIQIQQRSLKHLKYYIFTPSIVTQRTAQNPLESLTRTIE